MNIDRDEARRVAALAHLQFDDAGLERMAAEMTKILTYIDQLNEVDAEGFEERDATVTPFREDVPHASLDRESVARNAPAWRDGLFVVPRVIEGSAGVAPADAAASSPPLVAGAGGADAGAPRGRR